MCSLNLKILKNYNKIRYMTSYINFGLVKNAYSYVTDYVKKKPDENIQILEPLML